MESSAIVVVQSITPRVLSAARTKPNAKRWYGRTTKVCDIEEQAMRFAVRKHANQKYGEYSYTYHLSRVAKIAEQVCTLYNLPKELLVPAAWLHDTLEDTQTTWDELTLQFNSAIATLVEAVTDADGKNRKERAIKTLPKIRKHGIHAVALKLCDRIANVEASLGGVGNVKLFKMYKKEYPAFKEALYQQGELWMVWDWLDFIIGSDTHSLDKV